MLSGHLAQQFILCVCRFNSPNHLRTLRLIAPFCFVTRKVVHLGYLCDHSAFHWFSFQILWFQAMDSTLMLYFGNQSTFF
jgi:hypothetical protein